MNTISKRILGGVAGMAAAVTMVSPAFAADSASGSGTGALAARGKGTAELAGDLDAMSVSGRGVLVVIDRAGDATISISGRGVSRVKGGTRVYAGFNGSARISGSDVTVRLAGENVRLLAKGDGTFSLKGVGVYDTTPTAPGGEGTWTAAGTSGEL